MKKTKTFIRNTYIPFVVRNAVSRLPNKRLTPDQMVEFSKTLYDQINKKEKELKTEKITKRSINTLCILLFIAGLGLLFAPLFV